MSSDSSRVDRTESIEEIADILKLLGDRSRLTILSLLRQKERCVCELVDALETSQPNISQHLRKLKAAGLVREERRSQWVYYSLAMSEDSFALRLLKELPCPPPASKNGQCC
jgi:ArsR family transcriptional regulator, arsenate/arsenite/antimonite-responsive transcriptional repressor